MKKKYSALPELLLRSIFYTLINYVLLSMVLSFRLQRLLADLLWLGCILISTFIAFFVGYIQGSFASF